MSHQDWQLIIPVVAGAGPGYAYTVGLRPAFGHPEVAVFGLPPERAGLLNLVGELVRDGVTLQPGHEVCEIALGRAQVRAVDRSWHGLFERARDREELEFHQLIWPDQDGAYPWEARFDRRRRGHQPSLWLPVADHAPGWWTKQVRRRRP